MHHCLIEGGANSTQAASELARGTACSTGPPQQTPTAALALPPRRSASSMQPMYRGLNEDTTDST